jgi:trimethylamine:corrinoid methyltransferase-like protein
MTGSQRLRFLTENEESLIYEKCLHILSRKGVKIDYPKALDTLKKAGAAVDEKTQNVRFSRDQIEAALRTVPKEFIVKGSQAKHDFVVPHPTGSFYTSTCIQNMKYHDPDTNRFVDVTRQSLAEWTQLADRLENIHKIAMQTPTDAPHETADVHSLSIHLQNTSKPLMILAYCPETVDYLFELMLAKAGSIKALRERPMLLTYPTSLSPLQFKPMDMETILQSCRYGVPVVANSLAISGATAPITVAGTVLLASVEILAMVVMTQIFQPGTPVIGSIYTTSMDMATGLALLGNAESMLGRAAASQFIKNKFEIPVETFSFMTDSYLSDGQAMLEKSLMPALLDLAGSDIQYGAGRLGGATAASPIQLIIDDQLFTIIQKCNSTIVVNEDTLALQEILDNSPDGNFVTTDHTLRYCRENIRPSLFVADSLDHWQSKGAKSLYERAVERYKTIRKQLKPQPLPEELQREMDRIVKRADDHLVGKLGSK